MSFRVHGGNVDLRSGTGHDRVLPSDSQLGELMSNLVEHARRELSLLNGDTNFNRSIIEAIEAFATYGHSGGSAEYGIDILNRLLKFENLTPLTDHPLQWMLVSKDPPCWQSIRRSEAFSLDHGKTYYLLSEGGTQKTPFPLHETEKT